jgi:hypothetical protein
MGRSKVVTRGTKGATSQPEITASLLTPAQVASELVTESPLDLAGKQCPVVAKVTLQGVRGR